MVPDDKPYLVFVLFVNPLQSTNAWRKAFKTPTILDCAPFLRIPEGNSGPDGCVVCLEDMKGDCARDLRGRPIVASIGMLHGSAKEMQSQMVYATNRALLYAQKGRFTALNPHIAWHTLSLC